MNQWPPLISVIIPAYNAEQTLRQTIISVQRQTYRTLEIIIVDDGSTDATPSLASEFAKSDPRITLIRTHNGGVASARNRGVAEAQSEYIAPIDADDIWHPTKIEKQIEVMLQKNNVGFVYAFYRHIDESGRIIGSANPMAFHGCVFCQHLMRNFVGNGSAALMRRSAILQAGGYDPCLRDLNAQGCEDLLLQLRIARQWHVECVPEYLVGYRQLTNRMSADSGRMLRSQMLVLDMLRQDNPEIPAEAFRWSEASLLFKFAMQQWPERRWQTAKYVAAAAAKDPEVTLRKLFGAVARRAKLRSSSSGKPSSLEKDRPEFDAIEPIEVIEPVENRVLGKRLLLLRELDRRVFPSPLTTASPHGSRTDHRSHPDLRSTRGRRDGPPMSGPRQTAEERRG